MRDRARESLEAGGRLLLEAAARFADRVDALSGRMAATLAGGGRILTCGNGGSAADAQHVATELAGRFYLERDPLDVMAITVNPSLVTALANDYGYDEVFARQIQAHGRSGDAVVLSGYMGKSTRLDKAIARFAQAYADQNERDYQALLEAINSGRIQAAVDR